MTPKGKQQACSRFKATEEFMGREGEGQSGDRVEAFITRGMRSERLFRTTILFGGWAEAGSKVFNKSGSKVAAL